jgi:high-affinity iron transporter
MRRLLAVLLAIVALVALVVWPIDARADDASKDAHRLVAVLQYVAADYPEAVRTGSKSELDEQLSFLGEAKGIAPKLSASFLPRIESIEARVGKGEDPAAVQRDCVALIEEVVRLTGIARAPKAAPELARGKTIFEQQCATCHGADGAAKTEVAAKLDPRPVSFREGPRIEGLTPFRVFNATMYGLKGTAMPPFPALDEQDRWAVAFYVLSLRHSCSSPSGAPQVALERLATASDEELRKEHGGAVGCLRTKLPSVDVGAQILFAKSAVKQAMQLSKSGDSAGARKAILDAYLSGVEPVEPLLRSRDSALVARLEEAFLAMRLAAERGQTDLDKEGARVLELLETARRSGSKTTERSVFGLSFLIMMREGFEVVVVLGALLAVLKKTGAREHTGAVHAGWIAALFVGALVFVFARKWVAGSNREWLEGVVALVAVFMLLYAAFWLNARANTRKFMGEIRDQMKDKLARGGRVGAGLFAISFSSMLRESVETAMFLQGLAIDSVRATVWGAIAGLVVLLAVVLAMSRFGLKLPLRVLFDVSTILLFVTAVILLGKGIHALQEVGMIPLRPIPMVRIDILGVFPDAWGLGAQVLLACTPFIYRALRKSDDSRATSQSAA